jgi:exopolysaccharide biosynthesis polyprenyl glycosylphosphotransferase
LGRFKALGPTDGIVRVVEEQAIDEVIITLPWISHRKIMAIMDACQRQRVRFRIVPDLFELSLSRVDIDEVNGIPLLGLREVSISRTSWLIKRAVDTAVAAIMLVLTAPLMLLAAIAIKLESPGPAVFAQVRVGQGGRLFTVYKFRSMRLGAEEKLPELAAQSEAGKILFKMRQDPRHTSVGRFLRRSSIDELPQLYNILRGEMSIVGPRPALPSEVAQYEDWHRKRLEVPPGMTGLWQVMGRSEIPFDEMVMLDIYYIENWSLGLDFRIMLRTIPTVLSGRGAY